MNPTEIVSRPVVQRFLGGLIGFSGVLLFLLRPFSDAGQDPLLWLLLLLGLPFGFASSRFVKRQGFWFCLGLGVLAAFAFFFLLLLLITVFRGPLVVY